MRSRTEFKATIKLGAFQRAKGCCEQCKSGVKLLTGDIFYDHRIPDAMGGEATLDNCQVLCRSHHDAKTRKADVPAIAKVKRIERKRIGIRKPSKLQSRGFSKAPAQRSATRPIERRT
jgi:5-methylcytosine-specific restriction protein A